jgi:MoxR-like ATPase
LSTAAVGNSAPASGASPSHFGDAREVVGRSAEAEVLEAALVSGAHVLLEGPPGTGKSTLLRSVAGGGEIPFVMVEGTAELTPARLIGHFDPALVLSKGYVPDIFEDGPLLDAMRTGGLLYVEELNRIPEETINVLLTAMSELEITVPRLGRVAAQPGFRLVAAMNPFDAVGTARVSAALYDRTCRISMDYQPAEAEQQIVGLRVSVDPDWRAKVVALVRSTREHPDIRFGSSVRGAIDICRLAVELARMRRTRTDDWHVGLAAAKASLSGRIRLHDGCTRTPEQVVTDLYIGVFGQDPTDNDRTDPGREAMPGER